MLRLYVEHILAVPQRSGDGLRNHFLLRHLGIASTSTTTCSSTGVLVGTSSHLPSSRRVVGLCRRWHSTHISTQRLHHRHLSPHCLRIEVRPGSSPRGNTPRTGRYVINETSSQLWIAVHHLNRLFEHLWILLHHVERLLRHGIVGDIWIVLHHTTDHGVL